MTPTISVALCTRNGERFIVEQFESMLGQTRLPQEIVVSDDGSTDSTLALIEAATAEFSQSHPDANLRLTVLQNPVALGVVRNFEQAISATTGDLIVLCDQDDRWAPDRIEKALSAFAFHPELLLVYGNARLVDEDGNPLSTSLFEALAITNRERLEIRSGDALSALLGRNLVTGATTMFRRTLLEQALPFPSEWVHDEWLAVVAAAIGQIDFLDAEIIDYRQHGGNVIGAQKLGAMAKFRKLREPREDRNRQLVARASRLVDRLVDLGSAVSASSLVRARAKLQHERTRSALPVGHLARLLPVLRESVSHGYARYGRGLPDALRDLLQPAR